MEAVLEDFEKRNANNKDKYAVEAQRRYLGGDSDHSILVKGLDMALLEQNRMRAAGLSTEDDDSLEQAFQDISSQPTVPKKRTREDLIRELKEKRTQKGEGAASVTATKTAEEDARLLEEAKKKGKFKPIGFKPVEESAKKKKIKVNGKNGERKKKKRKVVEDGATEDASTNEKATQGPESNVHLTASAPAPPPPSSEPEPEPDDFDIFAGAGEYEGIDLGDEEEDDGEEETPMQRNEAQNEEPLTVAIPTHWVETDEPEPTSDKQEPLLSTINPQSQPPQPEVREEDEEDGQPTRLVPLASSALPSIKEFLAMDGAAGSRGKRKKRGGKKEGAKDVNEDSKKRTAEAKADRDYKRSVITFLFVFFKFEPTSQAQELH